MPAWCEHETPAERDAQPETHYTALLGGRAFRDAALPACRAPPRSGIVASLQSLWLHSPAPLGSASRPEAPLPAWWGAYRRGGR